MQNKQDFILEIGTAELPAKSLERLANKLQDNLWLECCKYDIQIEAAEVLYSPRRIAIIYTNVVDNIPEKKLLKKGPAIKAAFDENRNPTKAAIGFASSLNVNIEDLDEIDGYLHYTQVIPSKPAIDVLPEIIANALHANTGIKSMLWGDKTQEFLRPVEWLLCLLGDRVVPVESFSMQAGNVTFGHRVHANQAINIYDAKAYVDKLANNFVIVDQKERENTITAGIKEIEKQTTSICPDNKNLLAEVVNLVEYPVVLLGKFSEDFLQLPKEVLSTTIISHQKCFPLETKDGDAYPGFILVSNIKSQDEKTVIRGNEQVVHARLSDAKFFFSEDKKKGLNYFVQSLTAIQMHYKLGNVAEQGSRIGKLIAFMDSRQQYAMKVGELAKFDLATSMVGEFPELQGIMGYHYALSFQEPIEVAKALAEQYLGVDSYPTTRLGALLAISYRLDHLVGYFGVGLIPKGTQDPFALRRSALVVVKIILQQKLDISLTKVIKKAIDNYAGKIQDTSTQVLQYILDRLKAHYLEKLPHTVIEPVLARNLDNIIDIDNRIKALNDFVDKPPAKELSAGYKRVRRILIKIDEKKQGIKPELLQQQEEKDLCRQMSIVKEKTAKYLQALDYTKVLQETATLKKYVDDFFDNTMIMCDDSDTRQNRINILLELEEIFLQVGDLSLLHIDE